MAQTDQRVVGVVTERCSCGACGNRNYESSYASDEENAERLVPEIFEVRVGIMCNRLCRKCLTTLQASIAEALYID